MKKKTAIYIIILIITLSIFMMLPQFKKEFKIFVKNATYIDLYHIEQYNKKDNYEIKSIYRHESFTFLEKNISYNLISVIGFENLYYHTWPSNKENNFKIVSGEYPKTSEEIIIPSALNKEYKLGDQITLNMSDVYGTKEGGEKYLVKDSVSGFVEGTLEYKDEENKKTFMIVGFYDSFENTYIKEVLDGAKELPYDSNEVSYLEIPFFTTTPYFIDSQTVYGVITYKAYGKQKLWKKEYVFLNDYKKEKYDPYYKSVVLQDIIG